jgi:hypothetical protein
MATTDDASAVWLQLDVLAAEAGVVGSNWLQFVIQIPEAVADGVDTDGTLNSVATLDGNLSEGSKFRWSWTSVPSGSANVNTYTNYPNNGAATPIDMTDNEGLYHTDAITGGTTFDDDSGNANDLTIAGTITLGAGKAGLTTGSASFDDASAVLQVGTPIVGSGDWTVSFWFKGLRANTAWRSGLRASNATGDHHIMVETGTDNLGVYEQGSGFVDSGFDMPSASYTGWHHITAVADNTAGTTTFFIDGVGVASAAYKGSQDIARIGAGLNGDGQQFADEIAEFAAWTRKVSAKEVWDIFAMQEGSYVGPTGKGKTLDFTADELGDFTATLEVLYGGTTPESTSLTATIVPGSGLFPFDGAGPLAGPSFSGGGADHFAGGRLKIWPLIGKK